jgi:hypothetical protein
VPFAPALALPIPAHYKDNMDKPTIYPDLADIFVQKAAARRARARRSFGEKILMIEGLRERLAPLKRAREQRSQGRSRPYDSDALSK